MMHYRLHSPATAPEPAQDLLHCVTASFGFLPNLFAQMAESPAALAAYLKLRRSFEHSSLSPLEQQVVALAVSADNASEFCASAHSHAARHLVDMPPGVIEALREQRALPDPKLNVLADFTRELVRRRGRLDKGDLNVFLAAGYTLQQSLDVVMGVALKTFSNFVSHLAATPLNAEFEADRWAPPARVTRPAPGRLDLAPPPPRAPVDDRITRIHSR